MLYDFKCITCGNEESRVFPASKYDDKITEDGKLKRQKCEKCRTISLYRHITKAPSVMGGTKGYVSMERWQAQNPGYAARKEDELQEKLASRHRRKVLDKINKQVAGEKRDQRHKGYGKGQNEEKLKSDDGI